VYRSDNWGESWTEITGDLPSDWGFPIAVHPHDPDTIFVCPGTSGYEHWVPGGQLAVYRSRDAGGHWERLTKGLPQRNSYVISLREGMATDRLDPPGLYLGTNTGQLYHSADGGERWRLFPSQFPPILSVGTIG
jgi:photosystem II stability/assembly factor-like uncharacterized protein